MPTAHLLSLAVPYEKKWSEKAQNHLFIALSSSYPNTIQPLLIGNEKQMVPSISFYETEK